MRRVILREFMIHLTCHKNTLALDDEVLELNKFAVIAEDKASRLFIKACYGKDFDENVAIGVKQHHLYHEHCRMCHTRLSSAHFDEQRPENICKMCKAYIRSCRCQINKVIIRNMVIKMNSEHGLWWDGQNRRII